MILMQGISKHAKRRFSRMKQPEFTQTWWINVCRQTQQILNLINETLLLVPGHFLQKVFHHGFPKKIKQQVAALLTQNNEVEIKVYKLQMLEDS